MTPVWHDNDNGVLEDDLQAYVDGELDGHRRAAIEAYLATNAAEAARIAAYRMQNIGLHALFDPPGERSGTTLPPQISELAARLEAQLRKDSGTARRPRRRYRSLAASIAVVLTAGTAGWLALEQSGWRQDPLVALTRQATTEAPLQFASTAAPPSDKTPAGEGAEGTHQVVTWLAAQPGKVPTRLPDLEALGFELVAERVITTAKGQPAAQLLYQDDEGQRVTLYMRAGGKAGKTSFTFTRDGEAAQFFWQDSHMSYSLIGKMAQEKLLRVAEAVNRSLQGTADAPAASEAATPEATLEPAVQSEGDESAAPAADGAVEPEAPLPLPDRIEEIPKET